MWHFLSFIHRKFIKDRHFLPLAEVAKSSKQVIPSIILCSSRHPLFSQLQKNTSVDQLVDSVLITPLKTLGSKVSAHCLVIAALKQFKGHG